MLDATHQDMTDRLASLVRLVCDTGYAFVTPTPATHARVNARPGNAWARDLAGVFGWSRPFRDGVLPSPVVDAMRDAGVLEAAGEGWRSTVRISTLHNLPFVHSAYPTSGEDAVFFGPDTYRFARAIAALPAAPVRRAVDIGCGAGPGAVLLARAHPAAEVLAVDINEKALRLTRINAGQAGVAVDAVRSDLLHDLPGTFDLIVANPPYLIDPLERAYRHGGGALGAGLSLDIVDTALERLAPGGTLLLYTGSAIVGGVDAFRTAAAERLAGRGVAWRYEEMDPDVFGEELADGAYVAADRIAAVTLTLSTSKDGHDAGR